MIAKLLRSLATDYGKTVILVSHDPKAVSYFPKVYSMRDGRFTENGGFSVDPDGSGKV